MKLTGEEAAAIALAFAALRAQAAGARVPSGARSRWSARSPRDFDALDGAGGRDGPSAWATTTRREAIRSDV